LRIILPYQSTLEVTLWAKPSFGAIAAIQETM
jgi:hypothetical protein